ncbi:MAG: hypothetical protein ABF661_01365 [Oenococcus sp.]|uniref:hypothetical protein n=1 Tax=Oenococcus sp. TaxID=1979414 RepID=UPI0039ED4A87
MRENEKSAFQVLTPCGICQERLNFWGDQVLCAIGIDKHNSVQYLPLKELQPHHWLNVYREQ